MTPEEKLKRRSWFVSLHEYGWTYQDIGRRYGLTRERVRQIVTREPESVGPVAQKHAAVDAKLSPIYCPGMPVSRLAATAGISEYYAKFWLRQHHPDHAERIRNTEPYVSPVTRKRELIDAKLRPIYRPGMTGRQLAEASAVTEYYVNVWLRQHHPEAIRKRRNRSEHQRQQQHLKRLTTQRADYELQLTRLAVNPDPVAATIAERLRVAIAGIDAQMTLVSAYRERDADDRAVMSTH